MLKLSKEDLESIRRKFRSPYLPEIPNEYIEWLANNGSGKHESGYEIFSEPVNSVEIFGALSQRCTGYFIVIGTKGWDAWIGYRYIAGNEGWEFVFHDAYDFDVELIPEGIDKFLKKDS
ncbi:MAG: hypothetical protein PHI97_26775 [Desulfobulbus sp.]|nr:hypothetical protein [Desulfobulbus sp.]